MKKARPVGQVSLSAIENQWQRDATAADDWWCKPELAARTREIFDRGRYFEERMRRRLIAAGFKFAPPEALELTAVDGALRGHADGIITHGPDLSGAYLIYSAIWKHKALNARGWREVERDGREISALPRAGLAVPGVSQHHQPRAVHGHKPRYV